jgi:hypothetical protein
VRYGRRKTEQHQKSMGSYELFAWRDAQEIAEILVSEIGYANARQYYKKAGSKVLLDYERKNSSSIAAFIQKSAAQRRAYMRELLAQTDEYTCAIFLILSVLGVIRARENMELRDRYRDLLVPGRGNRVTTAAMYDFTNEVLDTFNHDWPDEVFENLEIDEEEDDDEG